MGYPTMPTVRQNDSGELEIVIDGIIFGICDCGHACEQYGNCCRCRTDLNGMLCGVCQGGRNDTGS